MIHTCELTYRPTSRLFNHFIQLSTTKYWVQQDCWSNTSLSDVGISYIKAMIRRTDNYSSCRFIMRINPKRMIEQEDRIQVMNVCDTDEVFAAFEYYMALMGIPDMPNLADWSAMRIDYCIDISTPYVQEYIRLLCKGSTPYYCKDHEQMDGSLYLVSRADKKNRSITVNFYDKEAETKYKMGRDDPHVTMGVVEQARNILRLEIQCHKAKTDRIRKKYGLPDKRFYRYCSKKICDDVLTHYLQIVAKNATYQRRHIALSLIDRLPCTAPKRDRLRQLICDIATQHQTVSKVRNRYIDSGLMAKATVDDYLRYLVKHDINPVTISDNTHLNGLSLSDGLPSLYNLFIKSHEPQNIGAKIA